jgi:AbrB family looped-hinge helix DNA binding protein
MARGVQLTTIQARGVLALPAALRRRHRLEPGTQVEVVEREDGVIELHPVVTVPASQAWFWSERWQRLEAEVDRHVAAGEATVHESGDDLLEHLDALARDA